MNLACFSPQNHQAVVVCNFKFFLIIYGMKIIVFLWVLLSRNQHAVVYPKLVLSLSYLYIGNLIATINLLLLTLQPTCCRFRIDIYFLVQLNLNLLLVINHELAGFYYPITMML
jgi:hypothetical protein